MRCPNFLRKKLINCRDPRRFFGRAEGGGFFFKQRRQVAGCKKSWARKNQTPPGGIFFHRSFGKKIFDDSGGGGSQYFLGGEKFWKHVHQTLEAVARSKPASDIEMPLVGPAPGDCSFRSDLGMSSMIEPDVAVKLMREDTESLGSAEAHHFVNKFSPIEIVHVDEEEAP